MRSCSDLVDLPLQTASGKNGLTHLDTSCSIGCSVGALRRYFSRLHCSSSPSGCRQYPSKGCSPHKLLETEFRFHIINNNIIGHICQVEFDLPLVPSGGGIGHPEFLLSGICPFVHVVREIAGKNRRFFPAISLTTCTKGHRGGCYK